jgi:hypothetical protein
LPYCLPTRWESKKYPLGKQSYYFPPNVLTLQGINCGRAGCMLLRPGDPAPRAVCALHDGGKNKPDNGR